MLRWWLRFWKGDAWGKIEDLWLRRTFPLFVSLKWEKRFEEFLKSVKNSTLVILTTRTENHVRFLWKLYGLIRTLYYCVWRPCMFVALKMSHCFKGTEYICPPFMTYGGDQCSKTKTPIWDWVRVGQASFSVVVPSISCCLYWTITKEFRSLAEKLKVWRHIFFPLF